jgi:ABC-type Fe3+ transport system permease subunit
VAGDLEAAAAMSLVIAVFLVVALALLHILDRRDRK